MSTMGKNGFHEALDGDLALIASDGCGAGEDVFLYHSEREDEDDYVVLRGFFEAPGTDVTPQGAHSPIVTTSPRLHLPESELLKFPPALPRQLGPKDEVEVRGARYRLQKRTPDGFGMVVIELQQVDGGRKEWR